MMSQQSLVHKREGTINKGVQLSSRSLAAAFTVSNNPDGIEGVMEEFMVWLARAVKDAQMDERCCYHCSSSEHFIRNCLLTKTARDKKQLNGKEGMVMMKGARTPPKATYATKSPQMEAQEA